MSLTENQNDIGKAVRKVLNKPSEEISLLEEDEFEEQTSTPRVSKTVAKRKRSQKTKKHSKKRRYDFTSSDESNESDRRSQVESAASTIDEDEFDQMVN